MAESDGVLADLIRYVTGYFISPVIGVEPVDRGYLNRKWVVQTDLGIMFVKQYHKGRYPDEKLATVEEALRRQNELYRAGVACPRVYESGSGPIHRTPSGESIVIMSRCVGDLVEFGQASADQMYSLGRAAAQMHAYLNDRGTVGSPQWSWPTAEALLDRWQRNWNAATNRGDDRILSTLEIQRGILTDFDFSLLEQSEPGWMHWDLWADNVLFAGDSVSGLLDFDRMRIGYSEADLARAILSFALEGETLRTDAVRAFMRGYGQRKKLTASDLVRAFHVLYAMEAHYVWSIADNTRPGYRFTDELVWLTRNWSRLPEMLSWGEE